MSPVLLKNIREKRVLFQRLHNVVLGVTYDLVGNAGAYLTKENFCMLSGAGMWCPENMSPKLRNLSIFTRVLCKITETYVASSLCTSDLLVHSQEPANCSDLQF
jgi:hypothetical protein